MIDNLIKFEKLSSDNIEAIIALEKKALSEFDENDEVISSTMKRLENLESYYSGEGAAFFVTRMTEDNKIIGGAGISSFRGLPVSEGIGEVRDVVIDSSYRGQGIAKKMIENCISFGASIGFKQFYFGVTTQMTGAAILVQKLGFTAVQEAGDNAKKSDDHQSPQFYILNLDSKD